MQRYFVEADNWNKDANKVTLTGSDVHHISRVMRNELDDEIICIHPDRTIARCKIEAIEADSIQCTIIGIEANQYELPIEVSIIQSLPKGDKLELILQKGTELGATSFHLYQAERSIVKWDKKRTAKRLPRFQKIIKEAAEQSYRETIPNLYEPANLKELIEATKEYKVKLIAYEEEAKKENGMNRIQTEIKKMNKYDSVAIFIGPEGGFTANEIDVLKAANFIPVKLGNRILRTETASFYVLSSISYQFE